MSSFVSKMTLCRLKAALSLVMSTTTTVAGRFWIRLTSGCCLSANGVVWLNNVHWLRPVNDSFGCKIFYFFLCRFQ